VRSKFSCDKSKQVKFSLLHERLERLGRRSSHDLCAHAQAHSLEGALVSTLAYKVWEM